MRFMAPVDCSVSFDPGTQAASVVVPPTIATMVTIPFQRHAKAFNQLGPNLDGRFISERAITGHSKGRHSSFLGRIQSMALLDLPFASDLLWLSVLRVFSQDQEQHGGNNGTPDFSDQGL